MRPLLIYACLVFLCLSADIQPPVHSFLTLLKQCSCIDDIYKVPLSDEGLFKNLICNNGAPIRYRLQLVVRGLILGEGHIHTALDQSIKERTIANVILAASMNELREFKLAHPNHFEQLINHVNSEKNIQEFISRNSMPKACALLKPETVEDHFTSYANFQKGEARFGQYFLKRFKEYYAFGTCDPVGCLVEAELLHDTVSGEYRKIMYEWIKREGKLDIYRSLASLDDPLHVKVEQVNKAANVKLDLIDGPIDVIVERVGGVISVKVKRNDAHYKETVESVDGTISVTLERIKSPVAVKVEGVLAPFMELLLRVGNYNVAFHMMEAVQRVKKISLFAPIVSQWFSKYLPRLQEHYNEYSTCKKVIDEWAVGIESISDKAPLDRECDPIGSIDWFSNFPSDIQCKILGHSIARLLLDISKLRLVCKLWYRLLATKPYLVLREIPVDQKYFFCNCHEKMQFGRFLADKNLDTPMRLAAQLFNDLFKERKLNFEKDHFMLRMTFIKYLKPTELASVYCGLLKTNIPGQYFKVDFYGPDETYSFYQAVIKFLPNSLFPYLSVQLPMVCEKIASSSLSFDQRRSLIESLWSIHGNVYGGQIPFLLHQHCGLFSNELIEILEQFVPRQKHYIVDELYVIVKSCHFKVRPILLSGLNLGKALDMEAFPEERFRDALFCLASCTDRFELPPS